MSDHVHGCLKCRPDMVPDFDPADERYHDGTKCGRITTVMVDGQSVIYTAGAFDGAEGWAFFVGGNYEAVHPCPCSPPFSESGWSLCGEPRFGRVVVVHECPVVAAQFKRRVDADIQARRIDAATIVGVR